MSAVATAANLVREQGDRRVRDALRIPLRTVVQELVDTMGPTRVAIIAGVKQKRTVGEWLDGTVSVSYEREQKLRLALQAKRILDQCLDKQMIALWFGGTSPELQDRAPAIVIADNQSHDVGQAIMRAARYTVADWLQ